MDLQLQYVDGFIHVVPMTGWLVKRGTSKLPILFFGIKKDGKLIPAVKDGNRIAWLEGVQVEDVCHESELAR